MASRKPWIEEVADRAAKEIADFRTTRFDHHFTEEASVIIARAIDEAIASEPVRPPPKKRSKRNARK